MSQKKSSHLKVSPKSDEPAEVVGGKIVALNQSSGKDCVGGPLLESSKSYDDIILFTPYRHPIRTPVANVSLVAPVLKLVLLLKISDFD